MTIAEQFDMPLFLADAHLEYARLHLAHGKTDEAKRSLPKAKGIIHETGYLRRDPDLADLGNQVKM